MSWREEVDGIEQRRAMAQQMGGEEAVGRQHDRGRLTIRERIDALADAGTFREEGPLSGYSELDDTGRLKNFTPANYVLGIADVDGRPCVIGGEDFTQRGGSPTPAGLRKSVYAEDLALRYQLPLIRFLEGGGGSVTGTRGKGGGGARPMGDPVYSRSRFKSIADVMEAVPVVSAAVGAVAGFPAARLAASHFSVMTKGTSQVLVAGPAVVERALGEKLTKEELGGHKVHMRSGVVDNLAHDELDAMRQIRRFLSYLPRNASRLPERASATRPDADPGDRCEEVLLEIVPRERRQVYKMRKVIDAVLDRDSFFEMSALYGRSQITGLARLNGFPVGIFANDPHFYGGSMTADGARKVTRFIQLCDTFHLPIVSFVDEPGFMIGSGAESSGTIRCGVEAINATVRSRVPWVSVIVRKTYGVAAAAHFGPNGQVYCWPSAEGGALPIEGGVAVAFRREIEAAEDPDAKRRELEERLSRGRSPFPRAEAFGVHDLIDPRRTRPVLCDWIELAYPAFESAVRLGEA
ncbi:MAG: propionyl-CoA carboxylase [Deltaproteobacteria bacterium]|nr:propionyl-CoA carboxylase [Deltaproteobacteria bacterium]MBW2384289.1 propionyl-CoA carboxylase [Deltaproteobacteria bacterium]